MYSMQLAEKPDGPISLNMCKAKCEMVHCIVSSISSYLALNKAFHTHTIRSAEKLSCIWKPCQAVFLTAENTILSGLQHIWQKSYWQVCRRSADMSIRITSLSPYVCRESSAEAESFITSCIQLVFKSTSLSAKSYINIHNYQIKYTHLRCLSLRSLVCLNEESFKRGL